MFNRTNKWIYSKFYSVVWKIKNFSKTAGIVIRYSQPIFNLSYFSSERTPLAKKSCSFSQGKFPPSSKLIQHFENSIKGWGEVGLYHENCYLVKWWGRGIYFWWWESTGGKFLQGKGTKKFSASGGDSVLSPLVGKTMVTSPIFYFCTNHQHNPPPPHHHHRKVIPRLNNNFHVITQQKLHF